MLVRLEPESLRTFEAQMSSMAAKPFQKTTFDVAEATSNLLHSSKSLRRLLHCPATSQRLRFRNINSRKLLRRKSEIEARLANAEVDLLFVQDTWLTEAVEDIAIAGYYVVGRSDQRAVLAV